MEPPRFFKFSDETVDLFAVLQLADLVEERLRLAASHPHAESSPIYESTRRILEHLIAAQDEFKTWRYLLTKLRSHRAAFQNN